MQRIRKVGGGEKDSIFNYASKKNLKLIEITSKNDGIKLSKKTPLDNPLIPWTVVTLLPISVTEKEMKNL